MGGRRGYGPTHSQTIEKHFLGVPGLHVLAPCALGDPGRLLQDAIQWTEDPLLFVENKLGYLAQVEDPDASEELEAETWIDPGLAVPAPAFTLRLRGAPPPMITLAAYGYMAELARRALVQLAYEHEVFAELIILTRLSPFRLTPLLASVRRTGRLLTIEEGPLDLGWGAEVLARCAEAPGRQLRAARRLAALNLPVPASGPLENAVLPSFENILETCLEIVQNE